MKIIGVVGQPGAGKDLVSEHLAANGFKHVSMGDHIRQEMKELGLSTERMNINRFVTEKRKERGNEYVAVAIANDMHGNGVVSGFRNTSEIKIFKDKFGSDFVLIAVEAPIEKRYEWAKGRGRVGDDISFEQFKSEDEKERTGSESFHEVDLVIKMADHILVNDGSKEDLFSKIDALPLN